MPDRELSFTIWKERIKNICLIIFMWFSFLKLILLLAWKISFYFQARSALSGMCLCVCWFCRWIMRAFKLRAENSLGIFSSFYCSDERVRGPCLCVYHMLRCYSGEENFFPLWKSQQCRRLRQQWESRKKKRMY